MPDDRRPNDPADHSPRTPISRREILRRAGIGAGALAVGRAFLGGAAWAAPTPTAASAISSGDVLQIAVARPANAAQAMALLTFDDTHARPEGGVELLLWPGDRARLNELGIDHEVTVADLAAHDAREAAGAGATMLLEPVPGDRTDYRTLDDYNAEMQELATRYPDKARVFKYPLPSLEGRDVFGIEIATDVDAIDGRPITYIDGVHHAREWPAGEYPMIFAHVLLDRYATDPRIKAILDASRVTIVPIVNVDGFAYSISHKGTSLDNANLGAVAGGQGAYWRKNRRSTHQGMTPSSTNPVGIGVDPNRNYPFLWGATTGGIGGQPIPLLASTSPNPFDQTYYGTDALSEPDTTNVADYLRSHNAVSLVTNHTRGRLVLRPWGHTRDPAIDEVLMEELGFNMAEAMGGYTNQIGLSLYPTTGTTDDWAYAALGVIGYTFEHQSSGFHPHYVTAVDAVTKQWPAVIEAFTLLCENTLIDANHSIVRGRVVDADGNPVAGDLNLYKEFDTAMWKDGQASADNIGPVLARKTATHEVQDMKLRSSADGTLEWHTSPSIRPLVEEAGGTEAFRFTAAEGDQTFIQDVTVRRGQVVDLGEIRLG